MSGRTQRRTQIQARLSFDERAHLLSRLVDEFERRGWREDGHTALAIVKLVDSEGASRAQLDLGKIVGSGFRAQNGADIPEIRRALSDALG